VDCNVPCKDEDVHSKYKLPCMGMKPCLLNRGTIVENRERRTEGSNRSMKEGVTGVSRHLHNKAFYNL
jgi:hypothetical protein